MPKKQRRKLAAQLAALFHDHLIERSLLTLHRGRKMRTQLDDLSKTERQAFLKAAAIVYLVGADPREFIAAQFQAWEAYSQAFGKYILPHPTTLSTLGAQARYAQYKKQQEARANRKSPVKEKSLKEHYREERKLAGLVRIMRKPPEDILTQRPEEFTPDFLRVRGVWKVVKELYQERTAV